MLPPDLASRLRLILPEQPTQPQPVTPTRQLTDVLSDLVPGQRLMAEIQALLPNGSYRAVIAQRDVTLALPFSAKPGDALELEVVESDGKLTLAFLARRQPGQAAPPATESVSTTLSTTGKLIGDLLGRVDDQGKRPAPPALNGNQPLLKDFPKDAAQIAPVLKEALGKSGMFYEAHQARWVEGKLPTAALLQEPQGKFSPGPPPPPAGTMFPTAADSAHGPGNLPPLPALPAAAQAPESATESAPAPGPVAEFLSGALAAELPPDSAAPTESQAPAAEPTVAQPAADEQAPAPAPAGDKPPQAGAPAMQEAGIRHAAAPDVQAQNVSAGVSVRRQASAAAAENSAGHRIASGNSIPSDLAPLVRQQLDALATENYVWQGQIWPGQQMHWEIEEEKSGNQNADGEERQTWQTRLRLTLPGLGGIEAVMRLHAGGAIEVTLVTDNEESRETLGAAGDALRQQFDHAGLELANFAVSHGQIAE